MAEVTLNIEIIVDGAKDDLTYPEELEVKISKQAKIETLRNRTLEKINAWYVENARDATEILSLEMRNENNDAMKLSRKVGEIFRTNGSCKASLLVTDPKPSTGKTKGKEKETEPVPKKAKQQQTYTHFKIEEKTIVDRFSGETFIEKYIVFNSRENDLTYYFRNHGTYQRINTIFYDNKPKILVDRLLPYYRSMQEDKKRYSVLNQLMEYLDVEFEEFIARVQFALKGGVIGFHDLWYLFAKDDKVVYKTDTGDIGGKVVVADYSYSFFSSGFTIRCQIIKSDGQKFYFSEMPFMIKQFNGMRKLADLEVQKMTPEDEAKLIERGRVYRNVANKATYMQYTGNLEIDNGWRGNLSMKADGRVMLDTTMFLKFNENYYGSIRSRGYDHHDNGNQEELKDISDDNLYMCWNRVGGFSFKLKNWGEMIIDNCSDIVYREESFKQLVMDEDKKDLILALVETGQDGFSDIISGKGAGCIFLLHGTPGVGKTLTAEAVAELLHRPLYSVDVGELGTNVEMLETRLRQILELGSYWNAVILIDEADIFLEKRTEQDIKRNAMVGIFLRLLEYHNGVLFLTTNRVKCLDEAFHSRISISLNYEKLTPGMRRQIWTNLLQCAKVEGIDINKFIDVDLNGREIRTAIRLAQCLAKREKIAVNEAHFARVVKVRMDFSKHVAVAASSQ